MNDIKIVIPCRFGSSRLRGKPLLEINGYPIFWHVYKRCLEVGVPSENIIVATDNEKIKAKALELGLNVQMTSENHESGTDRINEVAQVLSWSDDDIVVNVQGDEPLIPPTLISEVMAFASGNPEIAITTAVSPISTYDSFINPNVVKAVIGEESRALYFTRSPSPLNRDNPVSFAHAWRHIGIYSYRVSALKSFCSFPESDLEKTERLEQLRALSNGMTIGVVKFYEDLPHGVDTQEDYESIITKMEQMNECR
ncbi:3-deoxy-manno-octulosonate cytidylyltransferase [Vibrio alginolyticus]|nr:3-deoxy-manno-octulosonate cytidylyltransferase [Vibrio alginolyticus]